VWQAVGVRVLSALTAIAIPVALALAGCGSSAPHSAAPSRTVVQTAFHGSPPALAAVHAQSNQLLGGGVPAFRSRLHALRGHPVIVNLWGSWCEPCQSEFPVFQRAAVRYGRRVAFLGVDVHDTSSAARAFLKRFPVTYPSYADPDRKIEAWLQTLEGTPQTFFFNARGREEFDHGGQYTSLAALERDIHTYLGVS
jgi:cytochrome c biogenesis protein CcmG/thiol:disulfide interchange protein DsbE